MAEKTLELNQFNRMLYRLIQMCGKQNPDSPNCSAGGLKFHNTTRFLNNETKKPLHNLLCLDLCKRSLLKTKSVFMDKN